MKRDGITIRVPGWLLPLLGGLAAVAIIGFGAWYFLIRDTGPSKSEIAAKEKAQADAKANADAQAALADAQAALAQCHSQLDPLITGLKDLQGRLNGPGIVEADYLTHVGNVASAYGQLPNLEPPCLDVGVHAEDAYNDYTKAADTWNNCVTDINCSPDSIDSELQGKWAEADTAIAALDKSLAAIGVPTTQSASDTGTEVQASNPSSSSPATCPGVNSLGIYVLRGSTDCDEATKVILAQLNDGGAPSPWTCESQSNGSLDCGAGGDSGTNLRDMPEAISTKP